MPELSTNFTSYQTLDKIGGQGTFPLYVLYKIYIGKINELIFIKYIEKRIK